MGYSEGDHECLVTGGFISRSTTTELAKINATFEKFLRKLRNYTLMKKNCVSSPEYTGSIQKTKQKLSVVPKKVNCIGNWATLWP